ncbi:MAG TPA: MBL fold metallo-hydrolase [Polyangia bacterium]|nr:MBL fold metallo-hydrolase [Polyangia bacterium]
MRLTLLGSGSSGNVAFVEAGATRLLVDAGLPKEEIVARLARVPAPDGPLTLAHVTAVLVTHDHADHAGCAPALGRPVFATEGTRQACGWDSTARVLAGIRFTVGEIAVHPVLLPHDAVETVGYVLEGGGARVGILTDCGHDAPEVAQAYAGCDVLVLEANHDVTLLKHGSYPPSLKRRVGGRLGHLSNDQAAALLRAMCLAGKPPRLVIAAHISQANNRPLLAKRALDRVLGRAGRVIVATQARGTPVIVVENGRVTVEPGLNEQLAFNFAARAGEELQ